MTDWKHVPDEYCYGVALYNFNDSSEYKIKLTVGDAVHLLLECEGWYYGNTLRNRHAQGIFPKSYIYVKECIVDDTGPVPVSIVKQPPVVQEITTVLREWGTHWKNLYVSHSQYFDQIKTQIYELINHRSKIISGTLPIDELKTVTRQVTSEIDMGNKVLGLDLVVRDKNGNIINPEDTSTIQLYYHHKNATERMYRNPKSEPKINVVKTAVQQYSNILIVAVKNFTCKMSENAELLMTLYDAKEYKAITENYVVHWSSAGLMSDLDQMYNLRVLFTDLGKRDLEREKIYLVCYVVRIGAMDTKETDHRRSSSMSVMGKKNATDGGMRRPHGVAAMEITPYMNGKRECDLEQEFSVPFINCEKDNLEQTLKKITNKDFNKLETKNQALFISLKLLHGDLRQVREENPHLVLGNVSIARKMGFPEVILPGDVRNDLYLTLVSGEFTKGNKTSEKNVEVIVKVCNEKGEAIPGVISLGGGVQPLNEYKSVIYYHEDKPQWHETFKVTIPIDEFKTSHLKFTFKHRSSNEAKDKSEKPFAFSYVRLMQEDGTTLKDAKHKLIVYKIDYKKFNEKSVEYFNLPTFTDELKEGQKPQLAGLSISTKDSFTIASNICSTKLTQNVNLLGLLNWATHKDTLYDSLAALMKVDGEEVVKFLQDILDALFNILMDNPDSDVYDRLVFECLLYIISLVSTDWKYQHFEPVLDMYIKESFSATLAYKKLITVLQYIINTPSYVGQDNKEKLLFKTMKSLQYIMRFVCRSRILYKELYPEEDPTDDFDDSLRGLLNDIVEMMWLSSDSLLREQGACLKYLPSTISDIIDVFDPKDLSNILCDLLKKIPAGRLTKQKMMTVNDIVHSKLFLLPECRKIMLPVFTRQVKVLLEMGEEGLAVSRQDGRRQNRSVAKVARVLGATEHCLNQHRGYSEEVELCVKILSDVLELLFQDNVGSTVNDISEIMLTVLRTVIQSHINMDRESPYAGNLVAVMIDIFRQMTSYHYDEYIRHFATRTDILDFLMEILVVFKELVNQSVFPSDWCDMIMLQNHVILQSLRYFSHTIRDYFFEKFDHQAWSNFFHCAIAFMTQPALQLETFSLNKRMRIIKRYKDMRRETGFEIRSMWFNLGQHKLHFVPSLVGSILEMTLIPESELRRATIPIFFDMMQCEFYSSKFELESFGDTKRDSSHVKANFSDFENEMIVKLDMLIEGGRGDESYKDMFHDIMMKLCSQHTTMKDDGIKFVKIVTRLIERLLEYRYIINDENKENRMSCTVSLLDFYSEINRKEMYIRYVNKLCDLHLECDNFTEAAYTLQLHSKLLQWSDNTLPPLLKSNRYPDAQTHRHLKEALYYNIIDHYNKGKMWECALEKCKELLKQYEEETFDYEQLSDLHKTMSQFYEKIMRNVRPEPEYFRVGYYGRGFPQFLQNKVFIYRGKEYERLADFNSRILNEFPKAELLNTLTLPGDEVMESDKQYIQINKVDPIMDERKQRFSGKPVAEQIIKYYKVNHIQKFSYSRPFTRKDPYIECDNEFASMWLERTILVTTYPLPGILRWFPVNSQLTEVTQISPLHNAIETMEKTNKNLRACVILYSRDKVAPINPLSLILTGILDAAVMGGIKNYEEVFFTPEYEKHHPDDVVLIQRLKDLIADQIPLLELCVRIHKERSSGALQPLQNRLEDCFSELQDSVEKKYGKRTCDIKVNTQVTMRRHFSIANDSTLTEISNVSNNNVDRSRIPSLTRSQVTSFRQLTASFNFSASSPSVNSKSSQNNGNAKSLLLSPTKSGSGTPSPSNKKSHKTPKDKRRSSKADTVSGASVNSSGTQWYTSDNENVTQNGTPVFELRQELTPKRPLRSEVEREKRLSRPSSGQFSSRPNSLSVTIRAASSSGNSSNRDSFDTTDSNVSEEDMIPPPLPAKLRETDFCSLPMENTSFLYSSRNSMRTTLHIKLSSPEPTMDLDMEIPPSPPPKPPRNKGP